jgi:hypothetical protein
MPTPQPALGGLDRRLALALLFEFLPSPTLLRTSPAASLLGQIRPVFSLVVRCGRGPRDAPARSEFQTVVLASTLADIFASATPRRRRRWLRGEAPIQTPAGNIFGRTSDTLPWCSW